MKWLVLCVMILCSMTCCASETLYPFSSVKQEAQFTHLLKELRCLVCQNQDLADSNATLAKDLRLSVYKLIQENRSDDEIISFLTSRYGDFILFNPPMRSLTFFLWFGPGLFLCLGLWIFWRSLFHKGSK